MTSTLARSLTNTLTRRLLRARHALQSRLHEAGTGPRGERGDIPGWVMVVLMTAAIVAAVWALAEPALTRLFNDAIDEVSR